MFTQREQRVWSSCPNCCRDLLVRLEYLGREVLGWDTAAVTEAELPTGENNPAKALSEVEQLSEDEVEASIAQGLAKLEMLLRQD